MSDTQKAAQEIVAKSMQAAHQHLESGNYDGVIELCNNILNIDPKNHSCLFILSLAQNAIGDAVQSETNIKRAIQLDESDEQYHVHFANLLFTQNRLSRAEKSYRKALSIDPKNTDALYGLANTFYKQGKSASCVGPLEELIKIRPDYPGAKKFIGTIYFLNGNVAKGTQALQQSVKEDPDDLEALGNLATLFGMSSQLGEAEKSYKAYLAKDPTHMAKRLELINILHRLGHHGEALDYVKEGLQLEPENPRLMDFSGVLKMAQNDLVGAIEDFKEVISENPDFAGAHSHLAMAYLASGNYKDGWDKYSWRQKDPNYPAEERNYPLPLWDGTPQKEATLLLYTEQGAGDAFQFARFIELARKKVGNIILGCHPGLEDILSGVNGVDTLITEGKIPPFDLHLPLMDLPRVLNITLDNLNSHSAYLKVDADLKAKWQKKLSKYDGLKVGLVTSGNPKQKVNPFRTVAPELVAPFLEVDGMHIFSLQKTPAGFEAPVYPEGVISAAAELENYADTAAFIDNLDVVVSVCTSVAHLSGALGKTTFIMLSKSADWRWMTDRSDSPWYPSATLFRQTTQNDWSNVINDVKSALVNLID